MGKYIKGIDRGQMVLFPQMIEDMISEESEVRVIDAFVEQLDLRELGYKRSIKNAKGTNHYNPKDLLKLYLYGYKNKVRSSRKLEQLCKNNIEVMWLMKRLTPNFRTISDFRKENIKGIKETFKKLVMICGEMELISGKFSQDGVKIEAVNSKERNYTLNKLDDKIKRIEEKIKEYLEIMDEEDKKEEEKLIKVEELEKRLKKYKEYEKIMEERKESQISLTDKDSKLMKNNGKFSVCYNNQVVEDMESHITVGYRVNNNPADVGSIEETIKEVKEITGDKVVKDVTDKGYNDREDMVRSLKEGIIPEVTLPKGQENYELESCYIEKEVSEEEIKSEKKVDIKKVLESGKIPEVYKEYISEIEVVEKVVYEKIEEIEGIKETEEIKSEELREMAMKNKCFVRERRSEKVYCPEGEILRRKSKNKEGIKYCNKLACKNCKNPCCKGEYKEVVMKEGQIVSGTAKELKEKLNKKKKKQKKIKKVVRFKLTPKEEDIKKRMGVSEHPHGTMKRTDGMSYLLLKGKEKADGEMGLYYCASNLRRLMNIKNIKRLIMYFKGEIQANEV